MIETVIIVVLVIVGWLAVGYTAASHGVAFERRVFPLTHELEENAVLFYTLITLMGPVSAVPYVGARVMFMLSHRNRGYGLRFEFDFGWPLIKKE